MVEDLELPVLAAPMAGGPSTPALVRAAAAAGGLGFLAAGYKTVDALAAEVAAVRDLATFGVNVFVPNPVPVDPSDYARYLEVVRTEAPGVDLPDVPVEDDDAWEDKLQLLLDDPVPVVSLTFASPGSDVVAALRRRGSQVLQTVTSPDEALAGARSGVDGLVVQATAAGAHSGTFTPSVLPEEVPLVDLLRSVRAVTELPLVAAGGIAGADDVRAVLGAGAVAAMVGTVLLRTDESGASRTYQQALADPARTETVRTRAFSGRPARALRNRFADLEGPSGYPAVHHLTTPVRRVAAAAGDAERINIWAGTGWRHARPGPAADVLRSLAP